MPNISRRTLLAAGLAAGLGVPSAAAAWSTLVEPNQLYVRHLPLLSERWPASHGTLRVLFLTDLHVGCPQVGLDRLAAIVDQANGLQPDLILLGGDYLIQDVIGGRVVPPEDIARVLAALRAPRGIHSVLGNHDWFLDGARVRRRLEAAGIGVLENDVVRIGGGPPLWVAGLADQTTRRPDVAGTLAQVTDEAPVLALAHDPATFRRMTDRPLLTLCGHTHGGQIRVPFLGAVVNASSAPLRWSYGHIVEGGRHLFVSAGVGTSVVPVRFNAPPEMVLVEIGPAGPAPETA